MQLAGRGEGGDFQATGSHPIQVFGQIHSVQYVASFGRDVKSVFSVKLQSDNISENSP